MTAPDMRDAQRAHWQSTFQVHPQMYGTQPSQPGSYAVGLFDISPPDLLFSNVFGRMYPANRAAVFVLGTARLLGSCA